MVMILLPGKSPEFVDDDIPERVMNALRKMHCRHAWYDERNRRCLDCGIGINEIRDGEIRDIELLVKYEAIFSVATYRKCGRG